RRACDDRAARGGVGLSDRLPAAALPRHSARGAGLPAVRVRLHRRTGGAAVRRDRLAAPGYGAARAGSEIRGRGGDGRPLRRAPLMAQGKVLVIVGTRPEGIKLAPVMDALRARGDVIDARVALTGQHTTLIDQVLDVFALEASWDLGIMKEGQDLYDVAHGCLDGLRGVVREFGPDMLLVQGDTATVFFGALVGFFERIRVGHVEAGLRSGDRWQPYPEEILRRMTGVAADAHFAPT